MARRRGANEGSIYKRADGTWVASVQVSVDQHGKRKRRVAYGRTRGEVVAKLDEVRRQVADHVVPQAGALKVGDYLDTWLEDTVATRVRPMTLVHYDRMAKHLKGQLGGVKLRDLSPLHVQRMHRQLAEAGGSPRLVQQAHVALHVALADAVRLGLVAVNVCDAVRRPRAPRPPIVFLDRDQAAKLLEAAEGDPLEALYALLLGSGMRIGEALGLTWRHLDLEAGVAEVVQQLVDNCGRTEVAEPKTSRGRRRIELPRFAVEALRAHRARLVENIGAAPHPTRMVFTDSLGGPLRRSNTARRSLRPLLKRAGLPQVGFHALRHTAASLLLAAGEHPKVVQERLGHASIAITLDTYSHVVPSLQRDAARKLDRLLG